MSGKNAAIIAVLAALIIGWSTSVQAAIGSRPARQAACTPGAGEVPKNLLEVALTGCVLDIDGNPVAEAIVRAEGLTPGSDVPELGVITDKTGRYGYYALGPGRYRIDVGADGYELASQVVSLAKGQQAILDFVMESTDVSDDSTEPPGLPNTGAGSMVGGIQASSVAVALTLLITGMYVVLRRR